jgi:hypothetical protein
MTDDEKELLRLLVKEAVTDGMTAHVKNVHDRLDDRLDDTRKKVWMGAGIATALSVVFGKLLGGH